VSYEITFARSARRELERLPSDVAIRILRKIESLGQDPRPRGVLKLAGTDDLWRLRSGEYRVVYAINDEKLIVDVVRVRHRRDAYQ
jgi:mRNA interferase RelE/StbE